MADRSGSDIPNTNRGFFGQIRSVLPNAGQVARNVGRNLVGRVVQGIGAIEPTGVANLAASSSIGGMEANLRRIQANALRRGIQQAREFLTPSPATERPSVALGESPFVGLASPARFSPSAPLATPEPGGGAANLLRPIPTGFNPAHAVANIPQVEVQLFIPVSIYPDHGLGHIFTARSTNVPGIYQRADRLSVLDSTFFMIPDYHLRGLFTLFPHPNGMPGAYLIRNPHYVDLFKEKRRKSTAKIRPVTYIKKPKKSSKVKLQLNHDDLIQILKNQEFNVNENSTGKNGKKNKLSRKTRKQRR